MAAAEMRALSTGAESRETAEAAASSTGLTTLGLLLLLFRAAPLSPGIEGVVDDGAAASGSGSSS